MPLFDCACLASSGRAASNAVCSGVYLFKAQPLPHRNLRPLQTKKIASSYICTSHDVQPNLSVGSEAHTLAKGSEHSGH